jgi:1-acyl-sn-glycerol-3-phosphate acyltransferase
VTRETPSAEERDAAASSQVRPGLDFSTAWARSAPACFVRAVLQDLVIAPLSRLLAPHRRRGLSALHRLDGPFIVASNHQSHADTSIIIAALPRAVRRRLVVAAASDVFFSSRVRATLAAVVYNAIPIERHRIERRSATLARELLAEGWGLLIYPEGHRSEDGRLLEFKGGAAYLADRTNAVIVPCYLENTRFVLPRLFAKASDGSRPPRGRWRTPVTVTFGPAILPIEGETTRRLGKRVEAAVAHLGRDVAGDPLADAVVTPD